MRYWVPSGRVTTPLVSTRAPLGISWTQDVGIQPAGVAANGSGEASSRVRLPPTNVTRVPAESTWAQHGRTAPFTATRSYRPAMLGGSLGSTSSHAPTLSSAIPIVITRSAIASPVCNGSPLPRLDVIHEVVVADRGGCAGRHANVGGADEPPVVEDRDTVRGHREDDDAGGPESHDERSLGGWYPLQLYHPRAPQRHIDKAHRVLAPGPTCCGDATAHCRDAAVAPRTDGVPPG